jgi:hypothetical protein
MCCWHLIDRKEIKKKILHRLSNRPFFCHFSAVISINKGEGWICYVCQVS